jgi:hypothetical protein
LIARMDEAIKEGFYLEASWIAYAVIEDRCDSALEKTGGIPTRNGRPIQMLGNKLKELQNRLDHDPKLSAAMLADNIPERIRVKTQ